MLVLILGPSKAGKSTLLRQVISQFPRAILLDLDAEEDRALGPGLSGGPLTGGWEGRRRRDRKHLDSAEKESWDIIVDVGAGSLQTPEGCAYFINLGYRSIAVMAPFRELIKRHRPDRNPDELKQAELSEERQRVYSSARFHVDTGQNDERSAARLPMNGIGVILFESNVRQAR